jgi:hypothetical protein
MKKAYRHQPATPKSPKKISKGASRAAKPKKEKRKLTAPIFNGPLAGTSSHYIRPFDPVWPEEETNA